MGCRTFDGERKVVKASVSRSSWHSECCRSLARSSRVLGDITGSHPPDPRRDDGDVMPAAAAAVGVARQEFQGHSTFLWAAPAVSSSRSCRRIRPSVRPSVRSPIIRPSVRQSIRLFNRPSVHLSTRPSVHPSVRRPSIGSVRSVGSVRPSARPSVRSFTSPSVHLSVRPSVRPSVHPTVHSSVRLSARPSVRSTVHLSVRSSLHPSVRPVTKASHTFTHCCR